MRPLTFFTSNQTKLAHARYVAEGVPLRIVSFKQRTYHAGYNEPRLESREELLRQSYESALGQCKKAGISVDASPFILEDTTVRIEAFSDAVKEYPGTEVKFWMAKQTFADLDQALIARGNDRRVSVRSDVLLHVPKQLQDAWQTKEPYLVFVGIQHGSIVDHERDFASNLVFPWLDNRSFNKWFVPRGSDRPFGSLPIEQANEVDFRRKSFTELFAFLQKVGYATETARQLKLKLDGSPTILLCGYTCSGKTTASQRLTRDFGFLHVEASDFMHLSYLLRHGYEGEVSIGDYAEEALRQKPHIAAEKVVDYILEHPGMPVVISGFRSPAEVEYAESRLSEAGKKLSKCFVEADQDKRFERLKARMRSGDEVDIEKLQKRDDQQGRMGLNVIEVAADFRHITNNASLSAYNRKIAQLMPKGSAKNDDVSMQLQLAARASEVKLEDAIKITLLRSWEDHERRPSFTTTQIAKAINDQFPLIRSKHKDNVSRYFNQDFYPYYEISGDKGRRRYRLSNTGYGEAVKALREVAAGLSDQDIARRHPKLNEHLAKSASARRKRRN